MKRLASRQSIFRTLAIAISLGVIGIQFVVLIESIFSERAAVEQGARKRADAALDMLAAVHTQAMSNRQGFDDDDGAVATLNGTMEQFSKSGSDVRLWVVMGPKIAAFQKGLNEKGATRYELELARDHLDSNSLSSMKTQSGFFDGKYRETRPIIYGQGAATQEKCAGCHEGAMGIRSGEVMGAYSAAVDLAPENATLLRHVKSDALTTIILSFALIATILFLLRMIALRPLERLTETTNHLAQGSLDIEIEGDERPDEIGDLARSLQVFRDNLIQKDKLEARNAYLARHDGMTGLPNRTAFAQLMENEIKEAEQHEMKIAVIGIDLNGFKDINDRHGHAAGDALLTQLASRTRSLLGDNEIIARFGGDEFVAAKRYSGPEEVDEFLDRLENAIIQPVKVDELVIVPAASFGVASYPNDGTEVELLIANADLAMYRAKADGNTNVCRYEAAMDERVRERRALSSDLRSALLEEQFVVHYQPQNCIKTGDILGYEALLRWNHPEFGAISPSEFVAIAEENGEIVKIGDWVLKTACAEAAAWDNDLKIAVNLSAIQLGQGDLVHSVHQVLLETGLSARRLELEITETALVANRDRAVGILRRIKALGVSIAIDDFGSGYSSLATLNAFPFDKIKMDRNFLWEAERRPESRAIIRAIVAIGQSMNVPVLAEGVETEAHRELLMSAGCYEAQGYYYGKPQVMPAAKNAIELAASDHSPINSVKCVA